MKKSFIISTASFVLAAMPIMGVFAADGDPNPVTDNLTVTVEGICTFTRTNGNGSYTKTMEASKYDAAFATSTFKAVCNADDGYTVKATFTALTGSVSGSIPFQTTTPSAGTSGWATLKGTSGSTYVSNNTTLFSNSGADTSAGTSQAVTYRVATGSDIAQGSYTGRATYTLTQN